MTTTDLYVRTGFPQTIDIKAGEMFSTMVEVWKPYSIIYFAFILTQYDIDFKLYKISSFESVLKGEPQEPRLIFEGKKLETAKNTWAKGTLLVKEPGIYKIEFDNSGSWFNSKTLRYTIAVLEPDFKVDEYLPKLLRKKSLDLNEPLRKEDQGKLNVTEVGISVPKPTKEGRAVCVLHVGLDSFRIMASNHGQNVDVSYPYNVDNIEWVKLNETFLEAMKQVIEVGKHNSENQITIKVLYNPTAYRNIFKVDGEISSQGPKDMLIDSFNFLQKLHQNLTSAVTVENEIVHFLSQTIMGHNYTYHDLVYGIYIDSESRRLIHCCRTTNNLSTSFDINRISAPVLNEDEFKLESLVELFFSTTNENQKVTYLAAALLNLILHYQGNLTHIEIYESQKEYALLNSDRVDTINKQIESYLGKTARENFIEIPSIKAGLLHIENYGI